ncbi:MAG: DUF3341 domain-containing protein [Bacteroidetes bacterium]|nr:DUF3341 domain-containing protein [Bacteroidota bacterium]
MQKHSIIGVFDDEDQLVQALHSLKEHKVRVEEVYTPYPVHPVFGILDRKTSFTWWAFLYGLMAVIGVLSFLYYTAVIDWPLNFGGKPTNAFPSFIVITIILTILSITILSLFTFSVIAGVYPGKPARMPDIRATDDKFIVMIDPENAGKPIQEVNQVLTSNGASEVYEKESELSN